MAYEGQFVKISNQLIRSCAKEGSLDRLGAYALFSYFLQLPSAPHGGMRNALYRHTADGMFTVNRCIRELQRSGLLFRNRLLNERQFTDCYLLRDTPFREESLPPIRSTQVHIPSYDFVMAPLGLLMDSRLSFAAKGLYLEIRRQMDLMEHGVEIHLTKKYLRSACHKGEQAFDRIWNQLKDCGYLSLQRRWNPVYHVSDCEILLHNGSERKPALNKEPACLPDSPAPVTLQDVMKQMNYDSLLPKFPEEAPQLAQTMLALYHTPKDKLLHLAGRTISGAQIHQSLRSLSAERFPDLLEAYRIATQRSSIHAPSRYLATCLLRNFSSDSPPSTKKETPAFMAAPSYSISEFLTYLDSTYSKDSEE